jgi:pimeloyl-ACP methyl ester carboxylesterase
MAATPASTDGRQATREGTVREEVVPFTAGDGRELSLVHVWRTDGSGDRGPVLLVHGAGVRAEIFRAPVQRTIVDELVAAGYDVWLENWRASITHEPNAWDLDEAAVHDHPIAVQTVCERAGADKLPAIVHCQGSTSFALSAVAGLVPQVTTIVSNAVSLHPVVPGFSRFKLRALRPGLAALTSHLDPSWGDHAPGVVPKALVATVRASHRECDNRVCRMVSFTYGSGRPALWAHEHLNDATHDWLRSEFGHVPMSFFAQMGRCVRAGRLVSTGRFPELPEDVERQAPRTDARFVLFAGADNRCFLPASQERTFAFLDAQRPGHHALHVVPGYGHLDIFMGRNAARDVFPTILTELG